MHGERCPAVDPIPARGDVLADILISHLVPSGQISAVDDFNKVIEKVLTGEAAIFIEGCPKAVVFEAKGWEHRGVDEPSTEKTLRGPRRGSPRSKGQHRPGEAAAENTSPEAPTAPLLASGPRPIWSWYIKGITDPELVEQVKQRIACINVDIVGDSGIIEEFIEDRPDSPFPQLQYTERPDRFCAGLSEGLVGVLVDSSLSR